MRDTIKKIIVLCIAVLAIIGLGFGVQIDVDQFLEDNPIDAETPATETDCNAPGGDAETPALPSENEDPATPGEETVTEDPAPVDETVVEDPAENTTPETPAEGGEGVPDPTTLTEHEPLIGSAFAPITNNYFNTEE